MRKGVDKETEARVSLTQEVLAAIQSIKYLAWEPQTTVPAVRIMSPIRADNRAVFPAPTVPMTAMSSPRCSSRLMSRSKKALGLASSLLDKSALFSALLSSGPEAASGFAASAAGARSQEKVAFCISAAGPREGPILYGSGSWVSRYVSMRSKAARQSMVPWMQMGR